MVLKVIEGRWEEVLQHAQELQGQRVRVVVLSELGEPAAGTLREFLGEFVGCIEGAHEPVAECAEQVDSSGRSIRSILPAVRTGIMLITLAAGFLLTGCRGIPIQGKGGHQKAAHANYRDISFDVSPDGKWIVFNASGKGNRDLYLLDLQSGKVERLMETEACEIQPRFSPDGKQIVYAARQPGEDEKAPWHLYLLDLNNLSVQQLTNDKYADSEPIFTPDGKSIVFLRSTLLRQRPFGDWAWYEPRVHLLPLSTLKPQPTELIIIRSTNFSPAGEFLFVQAHLIGDTTGSSDYFLADLSALKAGAVAQRKSQPGLVRRLAALDAKGEVQFLADGKRVVFIGRNPADARFVDEIWLGDLEADSARPLTNLRSILKCVRVDSKGQQVYFLQIMDVVTYRPELWRVDLQGQKVERVADSSLFDNPLGWKP